MYSCSLHQPAQNVDAATVVVGVREERIGLTSFSMHVGDA